MAKVSATNLLADPRATTESLYAQFRLPLIERQRRNRLLAGSQAAQQRMADLLREELGVRRELGLGELELRRTGAETTRELGRGELDIRREEISQRGELAKQIRELELEKMQLDPAVMRQRQIESLEPDLREEAILAGAGISPQRRLLTAATEQVTGGQPLSEDLTRLIAVAGGGQLPETREQRRENQLAQLAQQLVTSQNPRLRKAGATVMAQFFGGGEQATQLLQELSAPSDVGALVGGRVQQAFQPIASEYGYPTRPNIRSFLDGVAKVAADLKNRGVDKAEALDAIRREYAQASEGVGFSLLFGSEEARKMQEIGKLAEQMVENVYRGVL